MEYWIWLSQLKGIGPLISKRLLYELGTPENIYNAVYDQLIKVWGIGTATANMILNSKSLEAAKTILDNCSKNNIKIITCKDPIYSSISSMYPEMPIFLYYKGEIKSLPGIAVVGSRRCSSYGKRVVVEAAGYLAKNNIAVISGMAKGIDGSAHTACLNEGGYTIAFLGNGLDICYPKEHIPLMVGIIENGAVISEYPPGVQPRPEYFPRRNFLMSCWSEKILVVEASKNSGALITAKVAKEQGKIVLATPSDIYSITGEGTNQLIFNGAEIYLSPKQLLNGFVCSNNFIDKEISNLVSNKANEKNKSDVEMLSYNKRNLNDIETEIIYCLKNESKTIDEISKSINKSLFEFIEYVTMLEIEGIIRSLPGGKYTVDTF